MESATFKLPISRLFLGIIFFILSFFIFFIPFAFVVILIFGIYSTISYLLPKLIITSEFIYIRHTPPLFTKSYKILWRDVKKIELENYQSFLLRVVNKEEINNGSLKLTLENNSVRYIPISFFKNYKDIYSLVEKYSKENE